MTSIHQQPDNVWALILSNVQSANYNAGTITLETIPDNIKSLFISPPNRNWESDREKLYDHGKYILEGIRTDIAGVHIQRPEVLSQLLDLAESSSFVFLTGGRGCGKSAIIREFAQYAGKQYPIFCLRTEDLNESHLDKVFATIGLSNSLG